MSDFIILCLSFPTLIFTAFLAVSVLYWLVSLLGVVDVDGIEGIDGVEVDSEIFGSFFGLLATLGLSGVPLPVSVTVWSLFSWLACYFAENLLLVIGFYGGWMVGIHALITVAALVLGYGVAVVAARVLRPLFCKLYAKPVDPSLVGLEGRVTGLSTTPHRGRARVSRDGVDLTINVRSSGTLSRGMRVTLVEYLEADKSYWVDVNH
ncbi:hypothetical protein ACUN9Y_20460 [Halomonas sp. V046]|uniref:hypothetical protein n=1 Tax=Halomonas sp. V046 TaxID=3459611 RepID=UPI00404471FF